MCEERNSKMRTIPEINHVCRKRSVSLSSVMTPTHHDDDEGKKVTLFDSKALILQFNNLSVTPRTLSLTTLCTKSDQSLVLDDKRPECLGRKSSSDASSTGILKRKAVVKHWKFKAKFGFKHKPKKLVLQPAKFKFLKRDSESIVRDFTNDLATELDIILNVSVSKQSSCRVKSARQPTTNYKVGGRKGRPSVDHKELFENISTQKRRKASSCAQQARVLTPQDEMSLAIDILTDYLEESVLFPKKMSYMAELMYT